VRLVRLRVPETLNAAKSRRDPMTKAELVDTIATETGVSLIFFGSMKARWTS
jgi:hypothetical protein